MVAKQTLYWKFQCTGCDFKNSPKMLDPLNGTLFEA
jgi:hypothetical protein